MKFNPVFYFDTVSQTVEKPDMVIISDEIITMELDDRNYSYIEIKDGYVTKLEESVSSVYLNDQEVIKLDLTDATIFPGFIDSHSHWFGDNIQIDISREEAINLAASNGWTSISELFANEERINEAVNLDNSGKLAVRMNMYLPLSYSEQRFGNWYQDYEPHDMLSNKVRIAGIKLFMDGGPFVGYEGRNYWFTPEELSPMVKEAHDLGFQIAIHSIVDNATDMALNALEEAQGNNSDNLYRHRLEHAIMLRDDQLARLKEMNVIVSGQLLWMTSDWAVDVEAEQGAESYLHLLSRWRDVIHQNIVFIGSTDMPWGVPIELATDASTAMHGIYRTVTRKGSQGIEPPEYMSNQTITVMEAIRSITVDAAYGTFEESVKGSIKVGKYADFTILNDNPLTVDIEDITSIENVVTIVNGEIVFCADQLDQSCNIDNQSTETTSELLLSSRNLLEMTLIIYVITIFKRKKNKLLNL